MPSPKASKPRDPTSALTPSPQPMTALPADLEKRLMELEIKTSLADDLLDQLNHTVFKQQQQIELLVRELVELRNQAQDRPAQGASLKDDIPPHY